MDSKTKKDKATQKIDEFPKYISLKIAELGWSKEEAAKQINISPVEINKIIGDERLGLTAEKFYRAYKGFGDTCIEAFKLVYPSLNLELSKYKVPERNKFGNFMLQFESEIDENSPKIIAEKTGIPNHRINRLYFKDGGLQAHELLLIEAAIGKKPGELFEALYGKN